MISVIVPHLNQPEALLRCLTSLCGGDQPAGVEILVVDNGSAERPSAICDRFSNVRLLDQPEPGPGPARNLGVAASNGEILAFIDADCVAHPNWLATIERQFEKAADDPILGGSVHILCKDPARPTLIEAYESVFAFRMKEYIEKKGFTGTGNLAVRRRVFDDVGPFGGIDIAEDAEWGKRATGLGYKIRYLDDMRVYHPARDSFSDLAKKWDRHISHDFAMAKIHRTWRLKWTLRSVAVSASPAIDFVKVVTSDRLSGVRSRLLAIAGLTRIRLYRSCLMLSLLTGINTGDSSARWNRGTQLAVRVSRAGRSRKMASGT